jgi:hypothetical protein
MSWANETPSPVDDSPFRVRNPRRRAAAAGARHSQEGSQYAKSSSAAQSRGREPESTARGSHPLNERVHSVAGMGPRKHRTTN